MHIAFGSIAYTCLPQSDSVCDTLTHFITQNATANNAVVQYTKDRMHVVDVHLSSCN